MDKIYKGVLNSSTIGFNAQKKVLKMVEASGSYPHEDCEVERVLKVSLLACSGQFDCASQATTDNLADHLDLIQSIQYSSCLIYKSWTKSHTALSFNIAEAFLNDFITSQSHEVSNIIIVKGLCDFLHTLAELNFTKVFTSDESRKDLVDQVVIKLAASARSMTDLAAVADLVLKTPTILPADPVKILSPIIQKMGSLLATNLDAKGVGKYISHASTIAKLVRFVWSSSTSPKEMILYSLKTLLLITSQDRTVEVALSLATVLQSVPQV